MREYRDSAHGSPTCGLRDVILGWLMAGGRFNLRFGR